MIPIIYEATETAFASNGLGRLHELIECSVTEERNGIYECDFSISVDGENYDLIKPGRIIGVRHDDTDDIQPFDIVSYSKPISGVVTFHAVHISYRQSGLTVYGSGINSLADALTMLTGAEPSNPFVYSADFTSSAYMAAADGVPRSVRQMLGGVEGSILDTYGGEYEWDKWNVVLHKERGAARDLTIRYGVNMLDYKDDTDTQGTYSACVPFWKGSDGVGGEVVVIGSRVDSGLPTASGRNDCIPLDMTDKFDSQPTVAALENAALSYMQNHQVNIPDQNITVDFVRLQDIGYEDLGALLQCRLCDTVNVVFPRYNMTGRFKIVKTVFDVLAGRFKKMELGALSTSLAQALGINSSSTGIAQSTVNDVVIEEGGNGNPNTWNYRKWASGLLECWARHYVSSMNISTTTGQLKYGTVNIADPNYPVAFVGNYPTLTITGQVSGGNGWVVGNNTDYSLTSMGSVYVYSSASRTGVGVAVDVMAIGRWK